MLESGAADVNSVGRGGATALHVAGVSESGQHLVGLLVGPLFLTAEVAFALKMRQDVYAEIQRRLGEGAHGARRRVAAA